MKNTILLILLLAASSGCESGSLDSVYVSESKPELIRIGSFNIQVFGQSKIKKPHVMEVLVDVVREFDVIAIQEIRSADQSLIDRFIEMINEGGYHYDFVLGPRLGRTSSKEQYAFIFNTETLKLNEESIYTLLDKNDHFHREPLVATFAALGVPRREAFSFTLVNVHTDPDEAASENRHLDEVFLSIRDRAAESEDDIILVGDFNASIQQLPEIRNIPQVVLAMGKTTTNTRRTKQYDNIIFSHATTTEFTGDAGVLDLMRGYNLSEEAALEVSDHLPIWAEFSPYENDGRSVMASQQRSRL